MQPIEPRGAKPELGRFERALGGRSESDRPRLRAVGAKAWDLAQTLMRPRDRYRPRPYTWQRRFRRAASDTSEAQVLGAHPNYVALQDGFCMGAYLEQNLDVADICASPAEGVFHYLSYGLKEGRNGCPTAWEPGFVRLIYGLDLPADKPAASVVRALRDHGIPPETMILSEAQYWLSRRVYGPAMAAIFDHEVYGVLAARAGHPLDRPDRISAIDHFCRIGVACRIPAHPDHVFDEDYYRASLRWRKLDPPKAQAYAHWARIGLRAGVQANARAQIKMGCGVDPPPAVLNDLDGFAKASPALPRAAPVPEVIGHLLAHPVPGASAFDLSAPGVIGFLFGLARAHRQAGETEAAEWLLRHILAHDPDNPSANIELADLIYPQNRIEEEIALRERAAPDYDIGANAITLCERLLDAGRLTDALTLAEKLPPTVFGDVALSGRRAKIGRRAFEMIWHNLPDQIERFGVAEVQSLLTQALRSLTPPHQPLARSAPIKRVAILANPDLYQCKLYRADQKRDQLRHAGLEAVIYCQDRDLERLRDRLAQYDAIIFMRSPAFPDIVTLICEAAAQGLATFYDIDDLIFDPAQFPPPLETYAGQITPSDHAAMACGVPLFRYAMQLCDYGLASTPALQAEMAKQVRSGRAYLHRNGLGNVHERVIASAPSRDHDSGKIVLLYGSGTKAHKAEFHAVLEPALAEILQRYPGKVAIRLVGSFPDLRHLLADHPDVQVIDPIWDFEGYCSVLADADINLSVLTPTPITHAKSEIKWLEAAMLGIPSVVSPTATHRAVIEDGETGFFANDRAGFVGALSRLIDDPNLRKRIGTAARAKVLAGYGREALGQNLLQIFDAIRPVTKVANKRRLLIVNVFYPPQDIGGATRVVQDNIRDLLALYGDQYEIDVITTLEGARDPYRVTCYAKDGARVWAIGAAHGIETMQPLDHRMGQVIDGLLDRTGPIWCISTAFSA